MLRETKDTFEVPEDFNLEDFLRPSLGVYQGESVRARIWFSPDVAGYIREKIWHETQKITPHDDGSIIFEAEVAGTDEIRFWVMSWGSHAEVLEPESLRDEIKSDAAAMTHRYKKEAISEESPRYGLSP